jgi:hypothetical protein
MRDPAGSFEKTPSIADQTFYSCRLGLGGTKRLSTCILRNGCKLWMTHDSMDVVRRLDVIKLLIEHAAYWLVRSTLPRHATILPALKLQLVVVANYYMQCEWSIVICVYFPNENAGLQLIDIRR